MAKIFREDTPRPVLTKRRIIIGAILLLAVAGIVVAYLLISKQVSEQANVAFTIDGKTYSKDKVVSLVKYSTQRGGDKEETAKKAFEYLKRQAAAKKAGIDISDDKIVEARNYLFPNEKDKYDPDGAAWIELVSYNEALTRVFSSSKLSDASGYVFIFPFDNLIMRDTMTNPPVGYGDTALIAKDRAYAEGRARYYAEAIKTNALSPEAALKEVRADARLGQQGIANTNTSIRFEGFMAGDATRPEVYISGDAKDEVINLSSKKSLGDVKVGRTVKIEGEPKSDADYQEAYYYFVTIDKPATSVQASKNTFDQALKTISATYKGLK